MPDEELDNQNTALPLYLCAIVVILLLKTPFSANLWLDESITAWITSGSFSEAWSRTVHNQGQSPLYFIIVWTVSQFLGNSELVLRMISVVIIGAASFFLYLFGRKHLSRESTLFAVIIFLVLDSVLVSAVSARPYSLALLGITLSFWSLRNYIDSDRRSELVIYALATLLTIYSHYLFALIIVVHALYLYLLEQHDRKKEFWIAIICVGVLSIPGAIQLLNLMNRRDALNFAPVPDLSQLSSNLFPPYLLVYLLGGLSMTLIMKVGKGFTFSRDAVPLKNFLVLLAVWHVFPPLLFFLHAHVTGDSLYLGRILVWQAPATALLAAALVQGISDSGSRKWFFATACMFICFREALRVWHLEDWRGARNQIEQLVQDKRGSNKVLVFSGLIELSDPSVLTDPNERDYLLAPFSYYPPRGVELILLPFGFNTEQTQQYYKKAIAPLKSSKEKIILAGYRIRDRKGDREYIHEKILNYLRQKGWKAEEITNPKKRDGVELFLLSP